MPLFIDRLPLREVPVEYAGKRAITWYPLLPFILTEPGVDIPPNDARCKPWKFDTGNALDASAWRCHLEQASLDHSCRRHPRTVRARSANDMTEELPIRKACLWLVSNIPSLRVTPLRLPLYQGLPFYDRTPRRPELVFPLIGVRTLRRAGLKVKIDFKHLTISVWTSGPWYEDFFLSLRRIPSRFSTTSLEALCDGDWRGSGSSG
jgi:hypothetical protein